MHPCMHASISNDGDSQSQSEKKEIMVPASSHLSPPTHSHFTNVENVQLGMSDQVS